MNRIASRLIGLTHRIGNKRALSDYRGASGYCSIYPIIREGKAQNTVCQHHNQKPKVLILPSNIPSTPFRTLYITSCYSQDVKQEDSIKEEASDPAMEQEDDSNNEEKESSAGDTLKDQVVEIPWDVSIRYMVSKAYQETYGDHRVWHLYRRNHKGQFASKRTREKCIRNGKIQTGSPCAICRDEYLVLDYRNVKLLEQFVCPYTDKIFEPIKTGLCQKAHFNLLIAIAKSRDFGLLKDRIPFKSYDYKEYYPSWNSKS